MTISVNGRWGDEDDLSTCVAHQRPALFTSIVGADGKLSATGSIVVCTNLNPHFPMPIISAPIFLEPACLTFDAGGTPVSTAYGDIYHAADGGHAQARHVFLAGNEIPRRWGGGRRFVILETGFGLGLNFLATWLAWRNDPSRCRHLEFVSVEKHPFDAGDLACVHKAWPEFAELSQALRERWPALVPGEHQLELEEGGVTLRIIFGDARYALPRLDAVVDAFYLDGFSPARNPELWSPELLRALARLAVPGATLATWSVAGAVRRALRDAGFAVERRPGFGSKRQMLVGRYRCPMPA